MRHTKILKIRIVTEYFRLFGFFFHNANCERFFAFIAYFSIVFFELEGDFSSWKQFCKGQFVLYNLYDRNWKMWIIVWRGTNLSIIRFPWDNENRNSTIENHKYVTGTIANAVTNERRKLSKNTYYLESRRYPEIVRVRTILFRVDGLWYCFCRLVRDIIRYSSVDEFTGRNARRRT